MPWSWDSDSEPDADPSPSCDGALRTQVDSCSDVPPELLDALEHDLTMEVPRRRVKRAFNNDDTKPIVSIGRFHVFSSEKEHRHMISSDDEPLIPAIWTHTRTLRSHQVGCCRRGWMNFRFTAVVRQIGRGCML